MGICEEARGGIADVEESGDVAKEEADDAARPAKKFANPAPRAIMSVKKIEGRREESGGLGGIDEAFDCLDDLDD